VTREAVPEAKLAQTDAGLKPEGDGWFVMNLADTPAGGRRGMGHYFDFEGGEKLFPHFGINVCVIEPGQANGMYHGEEGQEDFLVLMGECLLIVEGEERHMKQWDFFHAPPWTNHIFVGAGQSPCAILMVGARFPSDEVIYPVDATARKHGAGVEKETPHPREAYVNHERQPLARKPWPPQA
jgi:uncharacterized cupin superfamily protein